MLSCHERASGRLAKQRGRYRDFTGVWGMFSYIMPRAAPPYAMDGPAMTTPVSTM